MSAKKIAAIFAVIIMLVCPLAAVMGDAEGASKKNVDPAATHISLANLDKKDLEELFGISFDEKFKSSDELGDTEKTLLSILMPGININALREIDPKSFDISGVDIQFDYVQQVTYGTEAKAQFAVSVNVDNLTITFKKTMSDAAILASDELDLIKERSGTYGMPQALYEQKMENAKVEGPEMRTATLDIIDEAIDAATGTGSGIDRDAMINTLNALYQQLTTLYSKFYGQADADILKLWMDSVNATLTLLNLPDVAAPTTEIAALINPVLTEMKETINGINEQDFINAILNNFVSEYSRSVSIFAALQTILGTSDFGTGLIEKFESKTFDGNELTISGSASAKIYLLCDMKTQEVELPSSYSEICSDVKGYAITEAGINIAYLMQNLSSKEREAKEDEPAIAELFMNALSASNDGEETSAESFMKVLMTIPISEVDVKVESDITLDHRGSQTEFKTEAELSAKCTIGYNYNDAESVFNSKKDSHFILDIKELELVASLNSTLIADGKSYDSNGLTLDLSPILKSIADKIHGKVYWVYDRLSEEKTSYYTWFGFLTGSNDKLLYGNAYFERAPITYDMFLNAFSDDDTNAVADEKEAKDLIESHDGKCSHELSDAQKGVDSIKDAIDGKQSKDNSMLILGIVVTIIVILAIIGFAMIVRSGPGAKKKQKKPQIDYEEE